ncbi:MAG: hypothetical protein WDO14_02480 [Bacteroidota bacterium]
MVQKFLLTVTLLPLVYVSTANAQVLPGAPNPIPKSPNVEALDKYGDYSVGLHSGIPDISIPIYTVKSGELTVPITLNYHASGVKPTDVASWVGMGWSLSTGGTISRSIRGANDEGGTYLTHAITPYPTTCANYSYLNDIVNGAIDADPDIYSYSVPGKRGKFFKLYNSTTPLLVPYTPIKITWPGSSEYDIVDESGVSYRFGTGSLGTATEGTYFDNGSGTTAWHLMDMIAPNSNNKISWLYHDLGGPIKTEDISTVITVNDQCEGSCPTMFPVIQTSHPFGNTTPYAVQTITFEGGSVEFVLSASNRLDAPATATKYLDRIDIKDINGNVIRKIQFNYSYFSSASATNQALKLNSIEFKDSGSGAVQKYAFTYFTNSFSWNTTLANFPNARDFWGYYNGATSNSNLVIQQTISVQNTNTSTSYNYTIGGATDRNVNVTYITEGVLQKIQYPTGGYTTFEFESNKYDDGGEKLAGGLRVKTIKSYPCATCSTPIVKAYKYGQGESGYGSRNWNDLEFNYHTTAFSHGSCLVTDPTSNFIIRTFHSNTAFSINSFDPSPMSYKYVREIIGDPGSSTASTRSTPGTPNTSISGYTDYVFDGGSAVNDIQMVVPNSGKFWINGLFWKRGLLTNKMVYDNANNKLSETNTTWTPYQPSTTTIGIGAYLYLVNNNHWSCVPGSTCGTPDNYNSQTFFATNFDQTTGVLLPTYVEEKAYEKGSTTKYILKTTTTAYNTSKLQPITVTTNRVGTETAVIQNLYPFDLTAYSYSTGNVEGIYMLNTKNILTTPVETWSYVSNSGTNRYTSGTLTTFKKNPNNSSQVVPDQIYIFEPDPQGTTTSKTATTSNTGTNNIDMDSKYIPSKSKMTFSSFDADGNLLQMSKTSNVTSAYLYGYANSLPVAEVKNAQNLLTLTQTTANTTIALSGSPGVTTGSATYNFTVEYTGTVTIYMDYTNGDTGGWAEISSPSGLFTVTNTFMSKTACLTTVFKSASSVPPGNYSLTVNITSGGSIGWTVCGRIVSPKITVGGTDEIYYEGFEENPSATTDVNACHTGRKYFSGDFSVSFVRPNSDPYTIEYWYLNGSVWTYISKTYTGATTLTEGSAIDDVRIYPSDAQMKSYTYNTINGMTSSIDENGFTLIYEYDSFGRLYRVKNDKGGIEKQYTYNYNNGN